MTILNPHCGQCSQCIDRRFAVFAAGLDHQDPAEAYKVDLFTGSRQPGPDREMSLAFVRSASAVNQMTDAAFFAHYGETSRVVSCFQERADTVASRIFDLYRRHAATICRVFDDATRAHAPNLREGKLPADCLLSLIVGQRQVGGVYVLPGGAIEQVITGEQEIRVAIDETRRRVVFDRWGEIAGKGADLLIALAGPFRAASRQQLAPAHYPYIGTKALIRQIKCTTEEALRKRVLRCRNKITQLARNAGQPPPSVDAVIESSQWHGYRLNPDRIRVVADSESSGSE